MRQVNDHASPEIVKVLVGNKCDLPDKDRRVEVREGQELARRFSSRFVETSAKDGTNIQHAFRVLAQDIRDEVDPEGKHISMESSSLSSYRP